MSSFYKWFQQVGGNEDWSLFLADQEDRIVRERKPAFTTILAADHNQVIKPGEKGLTAEELAKIRYSGPFYVDFDSDDIEDVIQDFRKFLIMLRDTHGFNLEEGQYFASGGKGFHLLINPRSFVHKYSAQGYCGLPAIYKLMASDFAVDAVDTAVYTARKGRMFRTPNVERPDKKGIYKVPLTADEALNMTVELYRELIKAPRHIPPPLEPTINSSLSTLWAISKDTVDKAIKDRKTPKADENLLRRFGSEYPPTLQMIMRGESLSGEVGFNKIAMQLSISAIALGKLDGDEFVAACEGLCQSHQSNGYRYNTPEKRRVELLRMYNSMASDPCYRFSIGGVKSLLETGAATPDFDDGGVVVEPDEEGSADLDTSITMGIRVNQHGIYKKSEEHGVIKISAVGLTNPVLLWDVSADQTVGFEVDTFVDGHRLGRRIIPMDSFSSRAQLLRFTLSLGGCSVSASDAQAGALADILRTRAHKNGGIVFTTRREGLDLVRTPDGEYDYIWADRNAVVSRRNVAYKLRISKDTEGQYKTDLIQSPPLVDSPEARGFFRHLFHINTPETIGRIAGWMFAAFYTQIIRKAYKKFPVLQVYGQAGSGKSATIQLMSMLHYYTEDPTLLTAGNTTRWAIDLWASSSASIPLILDEYKPRQMRKDILDKIRDTIRNNYIGAATSSRGNLSRESGASSLTASSPLNVAPICFMGEALEPESAIVERSVIVPMNKLGKRGHSGDFKFCLRNTKMLSGLGRIIIDYGLKADIDRVRAALDAHQEALGASIGEDSDDATRPLFNVAVVLFGLDVARFALSKVFADGEFDAEIDRLKEAITSKTESLIVKAMSEPAKVLDTIAFLTRAGEREEFTPKFGDDYVIHPEKVVGGKTVEPCVDLMLQKVYIKYSRFKRSVGEEVLFDTADSFIAAMASFPAVTDRQCMSSPLKVSVNDVVYRFAIPDLKIEGVGEFKNV